MYPRYVPALLFAALFCVIVVSADAQKTTPHISKQTRMDLIRAFNSELVYIRSPFPMGKTGLTLKQGQVTPSGEELQRMLAMWGPAVKPATRPGSARSWSRTTAFILRLTEARLRGRNGTSTS